MPSPRQLNFDGMVTDARIRSHARAVPPLAKGSAAEDLFAFHVRCHRLPPISRHFKFALSIGRRWEADFACEEYRVLIEIDGGVWRKGGGAHSRPTNILRDMRKSNDAALLGWAPLRFSPAEVKSGDAIAFLQRVLRARGWDG